MKEGTNNEITLYEMHMILHIKKSEESILTFLIAVDFSSVFFLLLLLTLLDRNFKIDYFSYYCLD